MYVVLALSWAIVVGFNLAHIFIINIVFYACYDGVIVPKMPQFPNDIPL